MKLFNKKKEFYFALCILSGIFGFLYEVIFYYVNSGFEKIYMRGICFGPYIDIYVIGGFLIYMLFNKYKQKPIKVFCLSGLLCGLLEYGAGELIYLLFDGKRCWNYNTEILNFGNINGFVCLRSILFFALSGLILIYVIAPLIEKLFKSKHQKIIKYIIIAIFAIMCIDELYNILIKINILDLPSASDIYIKLGIPYWIS